MNSNFSDTSDPTIFAGRGNSREWDTAKPGRAGPGGSHLARPVVYSNHGTKPDPACVMLISPTVGHARSARDRLPGPACDILRSFFSLVFELWLLLFLLEVWRPQRARYSPRRVVSWVAACCSLATYETESAMPLYRLSDTVGACGLRGALIRRISRHDKCRES